MTDSVERKVEQDRDELIRNSGYSKEEIQTYQFRICYEEVDAGGIVYHARYFGIADRARTESIRRLGGTMTGLYEKYGMILVVHQAEIAYRKPLFIDDLVTVRTSILKLRSASCQLSQNFFRNGECVTELRLQLACLKKETYLPAPLPTEWKRFFQCLADYS